MGEGNGSASSYGKKKKNEANQGEGKEDRILPSSLCRKGLGTRKEPLEGRKGTAFSLSLRLLEEWIPTTFGRGKTPNLFMAEGEHPGSFHHPFTNQKPPSNSGRASAALRRKKSVLRREMGENRTGRKKSELSLSPHRGGERKEKKGGSRPPTFPEWRGKNRERLLSMILVGKKRKGEKDVLFITGGGRKPSSLKLYRDFFFLFLGGRLVFLFEKKGLDFSIRGTEDNCEGKGKGPPRRGGG